jgi:hypothetical protein
MPNSLFSLSSLSKKQNQIEKVGLESTIDDRILNFANSLDKNDKSLWNKTDGSPKIKLFKEHFGDGTLNSSLYSVLFLEKISISWLLVIEKYLQVEVYLSLAQPQVE